MVKVAVTGGIATGKSYVVRRLREAGVPVVDADVLAHEAVAPGSEGLAAVAARFGAAMLTSTGALDRARLAAVVFADRAARRDLERIIHPIVQRRTEEFFAALPPGTPLAVADIPLLFEVGREGEFDKVVVVACPPDTQVARVMARDGLSDDAARLRLGAQLPIDEKVRRAHYVIRTDGTYGDTDAQVAEVLAALTS